MSWVSSPCHQISFDLVFSQLLSQTRFSQIYPSFCRWIWNQLQSSPSLRFQSIQSYGMCTVSFPSMQIPKLPRVHPWVWCDIWAIFLQMMTLSSQHHLFKNPSFLPVLGSLRRYSSWFSNFRPSESSDGHVKAWSAGPAPRVSNTVG